MRPTQTIAEFRAAHPKIFRIIAAELAPYAVGGYLSKEGFEYFKEMMFDPRENACFRVLHEVRIELRAIEPDVEIDPLLEEDTKELAAAFEVRR